MQNVYQKHTSPLFLHPDHFFARQAMNIYDFGKINIMPNGDAYANLNHPLLGNIYVNVSSK